MKDLITKVLTTATAALGGLGTYLAAKGMISIGDIDAVNGAGTSLGAALVVILGAMITHLLMMIAGKFFRTGSGEEGGNGQASGGGLGLLVIGTAAALMGGLPSCSAPLRVGITGPDLSASYSSKDGLRVDAVLPPSIRGGK